MANYISKKKIKELAKWIKSAVDRITDTNDDGLTHYYKELQEELPIIVTVEWEEDFDENYSVFVDNGFAPCVCLKLNQVFLPIEDRHEIIDSICVRYGTDEEYNDTAKYLLECLDVYNRKARRIEKKGTRCPDCGAIMCPDNCCKRDNSLFCFECGEEDYE